MEITYYYTKVPAAVSIAILSHSLQNYLILKPVCSKLYIHF